MHKAPLGLSVLMVCLTASLLVVADEREDADYSKSTANQMAINALTAGSGVDTKYDYVFQLRQQTTNFVANVADFELKESLSLQLVALSPGATFQWVTTTAAFAADLYNSGWSFCMGGYTQYEAEQWTNATSDFDYATDKFAQSNEISCLNDYLLYGLETALDYIKGLALGI